MGGEASMPSDVSSFSSTEHGKRQACSALVQNMVILQAPASALHSMPCTYVVRAGSATV